VLLVTSGPKATPTTVQLTHENRLANASAGLDMIEAGGPNAFSMPGAR
jgi:hypothetical protein